MAPGIDMNDRNAWDDSFLINSWNDAQKEYQKYHSIHKSGKRLEDALSEKELKELRQDYGELLEETEPQSGAAAEAHGDADQADTEMAHAEVNGAEAVDPARQEPHLREQQQGQPASAEMPARHEGIFAPMPQALLGSVQDENLKNMMMSWYYAGYYTGLHTGQQQMPKDTPPQ